MKQLDVKPRSQIDEFSIFAKGDCGQAALAVVLEYFDIYKTVDELAKQLGYPSGYKLSTTEDVTKGGTKNGVPMKYKIGSSIQGIKDYIDIGVPTIALVKYKSLKKKYDLRYDANHFITMVGYDEEGFYYHDSYWKDIEDGKYIFISYKDFDYAWKYIYTSYKNERVLSYPVIVPEKAKFVNPEHNFNYSYSAEKLRYWCEELDRMLKAEDFVKALEISSENIHRAYELENKLKGI